ncbi:hypothetical protein PanWU01x14_100250 [Parasponia andersonii]|uniref:Uncharacterized protein n=1 Tax=Parasponia andersonii TaxID=3476 RepID=A0A2P5D3I3_PARAD|nr:hypothetical protein PanWU01x14_100250 [Parasponia andersonii]
MLKIPVLRQADIVINMAAQGKRECSRKLLLRATPPQPNKILKIRFLGNSKGFYKKGRKSFGVVSHKSKNSLGKRDFY